MVVRVDHGTARGYRRRGLRRGEEHRLPERAFQHWADGGWALEPGTFTLSAGSSSASLPLTAEVTVK